MDRVFQFLLSFVLLTPLVTSCRGDSNQLPANIYTINKVYDINNNNNSSDIRVEIEFSPTVNTADLIEARLVIAKATKPFTHDQITSLPDGNYFSFPVSSNALQVIKPSAVILDADGDAIVNTTPYKIFIAVIGKKDAKQLSTSLDLTLVDRPVYAGNYVGTWTDLVNDPNIAPFTASLRINDDYKGQLFYTENFKSFAKGVQDATIELTVNGTTITIFEIDQFMPGYSGGPQAANPTLNCPAIKQVPGRFDDDVYLILDQFSWADCDATRNVKLNFKKI